MKKLPISVEVGLSAKAEVKTEIPSESSGRFLEAITDIFRPFSEKRGLRADQIRLQREDVLIEIARKARERLAIEGKIPGPVSNKVLIPFLEKASLSDPSDETLKSAWANILSSASKKVKANHPIFIDILGKLDSAHLNFLEFLAMLDDDVHPPDQFLQLTDQDVRLNLSAFSGEISDKLENYAKETYKLTDPFADEVSDYFRKQGSCLIAGGFTVTTQSDPDEYGEIPTQRDFSMYPESITGALESLNLIQRIEVHDFDGGNILVWVAFHVFTMFGLEFFYACNSGADILEVE